MLSITIGSNGISVCEKTRWGIIQFILDFTNTPVNFEQVWYWGKVQRNHSGRGRKDKRSLTKLSFLRVFDEVPNWILFQSEFSIILELWKMGALWGFNQRKTHFEGILWISLDWELSLMIWSLRWEKEWKEDFRLSDTKVDWMRTLKSSVLFIFLKFLIESDWICHGIGRDLFELDFWHFRVKRKRRGNGWRE